MKKMSRNSRRNANLKQGSDHPGQLMTSVSISHCFRFQSSAAINMTVTNVSLGDLLCMASAATAAYQLANAVRIRKVEIWGGPDSTLAPVTVAVDFSSNTVGGIGPSQRFSDTSIGSTRIAHLVAVPPKSATASMWQVSNGAVISLFRLELPANAVIDIHYSLTLRDETGQQAVTGAVAGATAGQLYVRALDSTTGGAILQPLSYVTI